MADEESPWNSTLASVVRFCLLGRATIALTNLSRDHALLLLPANQAHRPHDQEHDFPSGTLLCLGDISRCTRSMPENIVVLHSACVSARVNAVT